MPIPSTSSDPALDNLLRAALTTGPQRRTVWAMLHDPIGSDGVTRNAQPIKVQLEIVAEGADLLWHPLSGVTLDRQEVALEVLRGERVWWCSWTRRFAAARLRVHACREAAQESARLTMDMLEESFAKLEPEKRSRMITSVILGTYKAFRDAVNGDREIRVLATFPAPRGYGEA
jgi:hypothetical protein